MQRVLSATATKQPNLVTARLVLRPFVPADLPRLVDLAGARRVADTMISVPHPYTAKHGRQWITRCADEFERQSAAHFAVELKDAPADLIGYSALRDIDAEHRLAELSFWIGEAFTGCGLAVEAAQAVLDYGFGRLNLNRVCAHHMVRNPASGKVLAKLHMRQEGCLRERVSKWGKFEDVLAWAVLRADWRAAREVSCPKERSS